jgi:DnaK suppressor protein
MHAPRRLGRDGTVANSLNGDVMTKKTKKPVKLPKGYVPSEDEKFMNAKQQEYFRQKLIAWKAEIAAETLNTVEYLKGESVSHPDPADTAAANADRRMELRTKDRLRKLTNQIDKALRRIEDGTYGYCEETGDPIRLKRLDARPIAKKSIEAQEMHERGERLKAS